MAKKKSNPALTALLLGVLLIFIGGGALGFSLMLGSGETANKNVFDIVMYVSIGILALGVILLVSGIIAGKRTKKSNGEASAADKAETDVSESATMEPTYVFEPQTYELVTVGRRQSVEEKFTEIGKMGKTQFVIYICKLFSLKGYEVIYTPIADNNNVDLLIKRDGITRAVGCLLANKVMCAEDVKPVYEGKNFYEADGVLVVTNMYFDRTALDFAKAHKITLVDRNILVDQYMN